MKNYTIFIKSYYLKNQKLGFYYILLKSQNFNYFLRNFINKKSILTFNKKFSKYKIINNLQNL